MNAHRVIATTSFAVLAASLALLAERALARPSASLPAQGSDLCATRLANFDTLDFDVYSNQKWDRLSESHAPDIVVSWPDGHETTGIARHIEDLKGMFVFAPNTNIAEHPIRICSGDFTAVTGIMTGTFSQPMPTGDGKTIAPTGKSFRLTMATIGHWKGTTMDHEWLFWDNQAFMQQIGLAH
jgi:predicted ester cyclase